MFRKWGYAVANDSRRTVTTTDHEGGHPRLVLLHAHDWEGGDQPIFWLRDDETTLGSALDCDIVLADLEPLHAVLTSTADGELAVRRASAAEVRVHGAPVDGAIVLRTGARIEVGPHTLTYVRDEHADHGRPFGGRIGGEAGHQRSNPTRRAP